MTIGLLQSTLFGDLFGTEAMREAFGEPALLRNCVLVEAALARAQARLGIVPAEAAAKITQAAEAVIAGPGALDLARLKAETATVGFPILPLVRQLAERAGEAGRWLHWGATTQDIMDSAAVLQIRDGLALIEADLTALRSHLAAAVAAGGTDVPPHYSSVLSVPIVPVASAKAEKSNSWIS
jgi:3-carboxy-cis,cis-muconate cycloisomerase